MTEGEWLAAKELCPMLDRLRDKASDRKQRLFAVACCRSHWQQLSDWQRNCVQLAECYVDGDATLQEFESARERYGPQGYTQEWRRSFERYKYLEREHDCDQNYRQEIEDADNAESRAARECHLSNAVAATLLPEALGAACTRYCWEPYTRSGGAVEAEPYVRAIIDNPCELLRDIFGNPFRATAFDPSWRTSTASAIARGMYESRDFSAMTILADALQDAGCEDADTLAHCRGDGPHVRGCWVVDLVLGRE